MSLTYTSAIIMLLGWIFQLAGVPFVPSEAEGAIKFIVEIIGLIGVLYGRYRAGGITAFGMRKYYPK